MKSGKILRINCRTSRYRNLASEIRMAKLICKTAEHIVKPKEMEKAAVGCML